MSFLLNSYAFGSTGVFSAVTRTTLNTSTGNQDITISGLGWTPKLAIFVASERITNDGTAPQANGSFGAADGTDQFVCNWNMRDNQTAGGAHQWNRAATDEVVMLTQGTGAVVAEANFVGFISNGVTINVGATNGNAYLVTVYLFGGPSFTAKVGTFNTATSPVTVTTNFRPEAMLFGSVWANAFDDTGRDGCFALGGLASFDGTTIRQCSHVTRCDGGASPQITRGGVRNDQIFTLPTSGGTLVGASLTAADDTSFGVTFASGTVYAGYVAMNFGGVAQAWAGIVDSPTTTGVHSLTGASFTPSIVFATPNMCSAVNTYFDDGRGSAWGLSAIKSDAQYCNAFQVRDAVTPTDANSESNSVPVSINDHTAAAAFDATFSAFVSGGVSLNFSAANGTVRKWPMLMIG